MERKKFSNKNFNVPTAFKFCFAKFITAVGSKPNLLLFCFIIVTGSFFTPSVYAQTANLTLYVATDGSDSSGTGSIDKPLATLNKAQHSVTPGTTVYVRGGTYHQRIDITAGSGTAASPVTYKPYPGETVVIDGTGVSVADPQALIRLTRVHYVNIIGFEVANSNGRGISADYSTNILIQKNKVHDIQYAAILVSGSNDTIDGNQVYNTVLSNVNNAFGPHGGWPGAVGTELRQSTEALTNINIINNYVHDSWGEGITASSMDGGRVSGNRIQDTFSILLYLHTSKNIIVDGNYLTAGNSVYFRSGLPARGIEIASESQIPDFPNENITISNNLVVRTRSALRYWVGYHNNPYKNLKVYSNTFKDSVSDPAIYFDPVATSGNEMKNNIIYGRVVIPDASAWIFSNNTIDPTGLPREVPPRGTKWGLPREVPLSGAKEGAPAKAGDANGDNIVNGVDYVVWLNHYSQSVTGSSNGDFNTSGKVDGVDYVIWVNNYGT